MLATVEIPAQYNGPPTSANGGYTCGLLARHIDGPARVRLHAPPPLQRELQLRAQDDGAVALFDGDTLVATAWPTELDLAFPPAPAADLAREAASRFAARQQHIYPQCYVCGTQRDDDGLCLHPGPVNDWQLLACEWRPRAAQLDAQGCVRPEIVWAALDCPGYFAAVGAEQPLVLLGELSASLLAPVPGDQPLVVYCWPLGREGRKARGATAVADSSGRVLALSQSLWITLKTPDAAA